VVSIRIYQGESRTAAENELLGEFEFSGLKPAKRGGVAIDVTFEISPEGIVNVIAKDAETGRRQTTTVHLSSGLTERSERRPQLEDRARSVQTQGAADAPAPAGSPVPSTPFDDDVPDLSPLASGGLGEPRAADLLGGMEVEPRTARRKTRESSEPALTGCRRQTGSPPGEIRAWPA
jgi:hypothetical protein